MALLLSDSAGVREKAASLLCRWNPAGLAPWLRAVTDVDPEVRLLALRVLRAVDRLTPEEEGEFRHLFVST